MEVYLLEEKILFWSIVNDQLCLWTQKIDFIFIICRFVKTIVFFILMDIYLFFETSS